MRPGPGKAASSSGLQSRFLHPPQGEIDPVLAEEGFAAEDQGWDAPVAGGFEGGLVGGDFGVEGGGLRFGLGVEFGEVEAGSFGRAGEVIALVPIFGAAPDQMRGFGAESEALA